MAKLPGILSGTILAGMATRDEISVFLTQQGDEALLAAGRKPGPDGRFSDEDNDWLISEAEKPGGLGRLRSLIAAASASPFKS